MDPSRSFDVKKLCEWLDMLMLEYKSEDVNVLECKPKAVNMLEYKSEDVNVLECKLKAANVLVYKPEVANMLVDKPDVSPHHRQQVQGSLRGQELVEQPSRLHHTLLGLAARGLVRQDLLWRLLDLEEKQVSRDKSGQVRVTSSSFSASTPSMVSASLA